VVTGISPVHAERSSASPRHRRATSGEMQKAALIELK